MLEVTDLTRAYGHGDAAHLAIDRVSLNVSRGELVSIVGPSGCGKSTLLRCVGGLIRPTAGRVVLRGEPVEQVPEGLAVVFQDYGRSLYPWLTVRDNVALPLRRTTRARAARRQAADASLAAVGLAGAGGIGGRRQVPAAAVRRHAAAGRDRPRACRRSRAAPDGRAVRLGGRADQGGPGGPVLRVRRERDITILLVTHDIDESVYVGDRVVVLTPGPGRVRADLPVNLPEPGTRSPPRNCRSSFGCAPRCPGWSAAGTRPRFRWNQAPRHAWGVTAVSGRQESHQQLVRDNSLIVLPADQAHVLLL